MVGWHHWLNWHEFDQAQGDSEVQRSLACCSSWDLKESVGHDLVTEQQENIEYKDLCIWVTIWIVTWQKHHYQALPWMCIYICGISGVISIATVTNDNSDSWVLTVTVCCIWLKLFKWFFSWSLINLYIFAAFIHTTHNHKWTKCTNHWFNFQIYIYYIYIYIYIYIYTHTNTCTYFLLYVYLLILNMHACICMYIYRYNLFL